MRKLFALLLCAAVLAGCSPAEAPAQDAADPAIVDPTASPAPQATAAPTVSTPAPDLYADVQVTAVLPAPTLADAVDNPALLEMDAPVTVEPIYDLPGAANAFAIAQAEYYLFSHDGQQGSGLYAGLLDGTQPPTEPVYAAGEEYPFIGSVAGGQRAAYFIEYNGAAWRLLSIDLAAPQQPALVDHGEGPAPQLALAADALTYAVETEQGYEVRMWKLDDAGAPQMAGILSLPQSTFGAEALFPATSIGITHVERTQGRYVALCENLDGIQTAFASDKPMYRALVGKEVVSWLDGETGGALCVYDAGGEVVYRYGQDIQWYAPRDGVGEDGAALFGGGGGLYMMSWNLASDPLELAVYAIAQGDGWHYAHCAMHIADTAAAYVLRGSEGNWQLARVALNEAFG